MTTYIYARVSTIGQNVEQQVAVLLGKHPEATVVTDKVSGKDTNREGLQGMLSALRAGDAVHVYDISRLSRNLADLLALIDQFKQLGVSLHVETLGSVDVCSPTGQMVVSVLGAVAEMQRGEMLEKQRIGIERAKQEGAYKGRRANPETEVKCAKAHELVQSNGLTAAQAVKLAGVGIATYWRWVKAQQIAQEAETRSTPMGMLVESVRVASEEHGMTAEEIAEGLGHQVGTIRNILKNQ